MHIVVYKLHIYIPQRALTESMLLRSLNDRSSQARLSVGFTIRASRVSMNPSQSDNKLLFTLKAVVLVFSMSTVDPFSEDISFSTRHCVQQIRVRYMIPC